MTSYAATTLRACPLAIGLLFALPAQAVPPLAAAEQLMNHGEATFPTLFPGHGLTQNFGPFRFRAYANGVLLGVAVSADPLYTLNGVYVMGGTFGNNPLFVGPLSQYITPTEPGAGPVANSNGCYDLDLLTRNGNLISIGYEWSGAISGTTTLETSILGTATFEGQPAVETLVRNRGTLFENGLPTALDQSEKVYLRKTGNGELTFHGSSSATTATTNDYIATTTLTTNYTPLWADRIYALAQGESLTASRTSATLRVITYSNGLPATTNTYGGTVSEVVTYAGRETITVPAGTYQTCRYERFDAAKPGSVSTEWVIVGKGLMVKRVTTSFAGGNFSTQTQAARVVLLNTEPL